MILGYLIIFIIFFICLRLFVIAFLALGSIRNFRRKEKIIDCRNARLWDAYNEIGVSIIVSDLDCREQLTPLLSLEINLYEVILITDFTTNPLALNLTREFSMARLDKVPSEELSCINSRGVYRSKENRYSRLMLVDAKGSASEHFNLGANLSRYDYLLALKGCYQLQRGSICASVREILEREKEQKVCAVAGFRVGAMPRNIFGIIDLSIKMLILGAGYRSISIWGRSVSIVFEREYLIQAGGYAVDEDHDIELFRRIERMNERTRDSATSYLLPKVFTTDGACKGVYTHRKIIPSGLILMILAVSLIFTLATRFQGLMLLAIILSYVVSLAIGAVALNGTMDMFKTKNSIFLILGLLFYPFYLIFRLIITMRF